MLINQLYQLTINIALAVFSVYLLNAYLEIFLVINTNRNKVLISNLIFGVWQLSINKLIILPQTINIIISILMTILVASLAFKDNYWKKIIFSLLFNAVWMLMETFCGYIFMVYFKNYQEYQILGSIISKVLMFFIIKSFKKIFTGVDMRGLPNKFKALLMLIPIGSIFVVNNIFDITSSTDKYINNYSSVMSSLIMLLINIIVFSMYLRLADELELKRVVTVYKQQLELYERHHKEREISILDLRNIKHNMKNNLIAILAYAKNHESKKIVEYIEHVLEDKWIQSTDICKTGNLIVDSLVNYWASVAQKSDIEFLINVNIPDQIPFAAADICLILGNALENAIEAVGKNKNSTNYIKLNIKYDKENLLIAILNSYNGNIKKNGDGELKSTKEDNNNHGIGLKCIYHTIERYHGTALLKYNKTEFMIKIILYKPQE